MNDNIQALIYTRPHKRFILDYCYFAYPDGLTQDESAFVNKHIRNVMAVESYCGDIRDVRWHILRLENRILVGIATEKFGRVDSSHTAIRGYYGILMPLDLAVIPSLSCFEKLDRLFVTPHYMDDYRFEPERPAIVPHELIQTGLTKNIDSLGIDCQFNLKKGKCKLIPVLQVDNLDALLQTALQLAVSNESFELVYGFNNKQHAMLVPVMNAVCHNLEREEIISNADSEKLSVPEYQRNIQNPSKIEMTGKEKHREDREETQIQRNGGVRECFPSSIRFLGDLVVRAIDRFFSRKSEKSEKTQADLLMDSSSDYLSAKNYRTIGMRIRDSKMDEKTNSND